MPPDDPPHKPDTLYEHAGGGEALHRLEELFYEKALADPVLKTLTLRSQQSRSGGLTAVTWAHLAPLQVFEVALIDGR